MSTSRSSEGGDAAKRILEYLETLFGQDPHARARASTISKTLDISATFVRQTLSKWAVAGFLTPVLVMDCTVCGSENDEASAEHAQELVCEVCGESTLHEPVMVFGVGDRWGERNHTIDSAKKEPGRKVALRHLRLQAFRKVRSAYRSAMIS